MNTIKVNYPTNMPRKMNAGQAADFALYCVAEIAKQVNVIVDELLNMVRGKSYIESCLIVHPLIRESGNTDNQKDLIFKTFCQRKIKEEKQ